MENYHRKDLPFHSRIFIGNFDNKNISREELEEIFSKYGKIQERIVVRQGYAFIQYADEECATRALNSENGRILGLKKIEIQYAKRSKRDGFSRGGDSFNRRRDSYNSFSKYSNVRIKIPLFVFDYSLSTFANTIKTNFSKFGGIDCDIHFVSNDFVKNPPNEKYLVYLFPRNLQNNTLCFCAVNDNGTTPGFMDTPTDDVMKYIKKDFLSSSSSSSRYNYDQNSSNQYHHSSSSSMNHHLHHHQQQHHHQQFNQYGNISSSSSSSQFGQMQNQIQDPRLANNNMMQQQQNPSLSSLLTKLSSMKN